MDDLFEQTLQHIEDLTQLLHTYRENVDMESSKDKKSSEIIYKLKDEVNHLNNVINQLIDEPKSNDNHLIGQQTDEVNDKTNEED